MKPAKYYITIYQGATYTLNLTYTDDAGDAIDLTGYTARMQIREDYDNEKLLELTTENGKIVLGGEAGTIQVNITATETAELDFDTGVYDLELVTGSTVYRFISGSVTLSKEVTK